MTFPATGVLYIMAVPRKSCVGLGLRGPFRLPVRPLFELVRRLRELGDCSS
jgi:hypothetical protein